MNKTQMTARDLTEFMRRNDLNGTEAGTAFGVHASTISSWLVDPERILPAYAERLIILTRQVAEARKEAADTIKGATLPPARRAAVVSGEAEDLQVVLALGDRLGLTITALSV